MGRLFAIEIIYRGIFQKTLAKNISRAIVLAAHEEGKPGISFGRYGDSPERNGIPAKNFAIVATDDVTLEEGMAKYEPKEVDITIAVDDTLCKGVESWAWYGLQPVNRLLKPGGTLIVTSRETPEAIIGMCHRKEKPYQLAVLKAIPSFSGLWVYKDDHTDVRVLGAISRILPELFSLKSVQATIIDEWKDQVKATSAAKAHETTSLVTVQPSQGNPEVPYKFDFPKWHEMGEGIAIPSIPAGEAVCPVKECVTMVNETEFKDNSSQWEAWRKDQKGYEAWLQDKIKSRADRSHGFRYKGQYEEQVPEMLEIARKG